MITGSAKVPLTVDNVKKCVCGQCPVQADSECIKSKTANVMVAMGKSPLQGEDIPGVYCSAGKTSCQDIDTKQMCICTGCPIWGEYTLSSRTPMGYFCRDGASM